MDRSVDAWPSSRWTRSTSSIREHGPSDGVLLHEDDTRERGSILAAPSTFGRQRRDGRQLGASSARFPLATGACGRISPRGSHQTGPSTASDRGDQVVVRKGAASVVDWYVMLFPSARMPRRYARLAQRWADAVGGVVNPEPHVTIAYLVGEAEPASVVAAVRSVPTSTVTVEASGGLTYSQTPHPLFGYSALLRVQKTPELGALHRAVVAALRPLGLGSLHVWDDVDLHVRVLRQLSVHPSLVSPKLAALHPRYRFVAARLVLSRPDGHGGYPIELSRRLRRSGRGESSAQVT